MHGGDGLELVCVSAKLNLGEFSAWESACSGRAKAKLSLVVSMYRSVGISLSNITGRESFGLGGFSSSRLASSWTWGPRALLVRVLLLVLLVLACLFEWWLASIPFDLVRFVA